MPRKAKTLKGKLVPCQRCGKETYRNPSLIKKGFGKFCSRACEAKSRPNGPVERICEQCGCKFMKDWWSVQLDNVRFCSRKCIDTFKRKLRKRGDQELFTQWQKREWLADHCVKCGSTKQLELDHKVPRFAGGKATYENAQTLCRTCNRKKFWTEDYDLYQTYLRLRASESSTSGYPHNLALER